MFWGYVDPSVSMSLTDDELALIHAIGINMKVGDQPLLWDLLLRLINRNSIEDLLE